MMKYAFTAPTYYLLVVSKQRARETSGHTKANRQFSM